MTQRERALFLLGAGHARDALAKGGEARFIEWFATTATNWGITTEFFESLIGEAALETSELIKV